MLMHSAISSDAGLCYDAVEWILLDAGGSVSATAIVGRIANESDDSATGSTRSCRALQRVPAIWFNPLAKACLDDEHP
jgi:hypothetical protein